MNEQNGLRVGERVRHWRVKRGYSLRVLSEASGLSVNAISRIERGENSPTVSSLQLLATALNVPITSFFMNDEADMTNFVHRKTGLLYEGVGVSMESLGGGLIDQQMEPFLMILDNETTSQTKATSHSGEEFVYCLKGEIEYCVGKQLYQLCPGDSLFFKAWQPHWCRKITQIPAEVLVIFDATQDNDLARQHHLSMRSESA